MSGSGSGDLNSSSQLVWHCVTLPAIHLVFSKALTALGLVGWAFHTQACASQGHGYFCLPHAPGTPLSVVAVTDL